MLPPHRAPLTPHTGALPSSTGLPRPTPFPVGALLLAPFGQLPVLGRAAADPTPCRPGGPLYRQRSPRPARPAPPSSPWAAAGPDPRPAACGSVSPQRRSVAPARLARRRPLPDGGAHPGPSVALCRGGPLALARSLGHHHRGSRAAGTRVHRSAPPGRVACPTALPPGAPCPPSRAAWHPARLLRSLGQPVADGQGPQRVLVACPRRASFPPSPASIDQLDLLSGALPGHLGWPRCWVHSAQQPSPTLTPGCWCTAPSTALSTWLAWAAVLARGGVLGRAGTASRWWR